MLGSAWAAAWVGQGVCGPGCAWQRVPGRVCLAGCGLLPGCAWQGVLGRVCVDQGTLGSVWAAAWVRLGLVEETLDYEGVSAQCSILFHKSSLLGYASRQPRPQCHVAREWELL